MTPSICFPRLQWIGRWAEPFQDWPHDSLLSLQHDLRRVSNSLKLVRLKLTWKKLAFIHGVDPATAAPCTLWAREAVGPVQWARLVVSGLDPTPEEAPPPPGFFSTYERREKLRAIERGGPRLRVTFWNATHLPPSNTVQLIRV